MAETVISCPHRADQLCVGDGDIRVVDGKSVIVKCRLWVHVMGKDPQTGADIDNADCAYNWVPVLLIENSKVNRETGASLDKMATESRAAQQVSQAVMGGIAQAIGQVQQLALGEVPEGYLRTIDYGPGGQGFPGRLVKIENKENEQ